MKRNLYLTVVIIFGAVSIAHSVPWRSYKQQVLGTVVDVRKHIGYSPDVFIVSSNPTDAPLTSRYYAYEVSIRVDCKIYVGRYETPFNYLPSAFSTGQPVHLILTKHVMYFDLPNDPDMRVGIVHRSSQCDSR